MGVLYLVSLLLGITCMLLLDHRFRLFFWRDAKAAAIVTAVGVLFLLGWDLAGIGLGIFLRGEGTIATGLLLAPELPIEEPVFLLFLVLCTMVLYTGARRIMERIPAKRRENERERENV
ncbi:C50 carotenoid epsilon cyclase [Arthrobacter sp. MYb23]|uniref:lycopene cyclase domain-containing protein n=1 Tax=unclassified Arthrobacter TaxID=235627 RepID=UPI000CFC4791|nr:MULTISPECIES: lycopene cyclase domain-containing protein [unclassified Arthrobacter]PRB38925.1 C50 carotenoid epsilon cyclase [Arthrobacter sp. MYb51]PRB92931.1 C50 carotenoid epsilon cyclase [Arthrobacter sp. MYb23]